MGEYFAGYMLVALEGDIAYRGEDGWDCGSFVDSALVFCGGDCFDYFVSSFVDRLK